MKGFSGPLRAAVILCLGLCVSSAEAVDPALSGSIALHFVHQGDPPNDDWYFNGYSGGITLTLPAVLDITTVTTGNLTWSDSSIWTTYPLDASGLSISHTGQGSYTFEVNNGDANLNVLQGNGPTEYSVNTRVTFPFVYNGVGPIVISNTVDTRYNVTLPTGAHLNHDQGAKLQNLTVNSGASMTGSSYTIRDNLTNHGSGNFNCLVEGDFINDAVAAGGNVANAIYLQIEGQLVNTGELQITQLLETFAATSNAGTIKLTAGGFYPQAAFANNGTFQFSGGGLLGSGVITNNGTFDWSGGHMSGNIVNATNSFMISGTTGRSLIGTLTNNGTINQFGGGTLGFGGSAILTNQAGALYDIIDDSQLYDGFASGTINNAGTFRKSGGNGVTIVGPAFTNTGTITVTSGTLRFLGGGAFNAGTMSFANGGTVELNYGNYFVQGSNSASGNGALQLTSSGATNVIVSNGNSASFENFTGGADLVLSGGWLRADAGGTLTLNLTGTSAVQLNGGNFGGAGTTINSGNFEWTEGRVEGNLRNDSANFTISGPHIHYIVGGNLSNTGTITHSNDGELQNWGGTLVNQVGALYDITDDGDIRGGIPNGTVTNAGTLRKSGGSGTSIIDALFTNTGMLAVDSGILWFIGPDVLTLDSSGTLAFKLSGTDTATDYGKVDVSQQLVADGTLAVSLGSGYAPTLGDSFNLLDWGSLTGTFDTLALQAPGAGLMWNASQLYVTGVLSVALGGDFNFDGVVDAADYVVWRKGLGTTHTPSDFNLWRANFGATAGSGSDASANATVPEPATLVLLILAGADFRLRRRRLASLVSRTR